MKPQFKHSDGHTYPVLLIDFVNDEFYILPESELEGGNQIGIKGLSVIHWESESESLRKIQDQLLSKSAGQDSDSNTWKANQKK